MEQQTSTTSLFQLNVDANASYALRSAATWSRVLAILGFIFGILFFVLAFIIQNTLSNAARYEDYGYRGNTSTLANAGMAAYIVVGIIYIIGSIFALGFASKASTALKTNDANALRSAFASVRNYFAFWSILLIICLLLVIISIAGLAGSRM